ncbi:MAG: hypothetical protein HFE44_17505 [Oscillospiraceae bacterium]|jgi:CRISPR type III-A/MTUBE-associated protein Csm6|nr:hypothetical protein [Oscillospiraceae bacterium]
MPDILFSPIGGHDPIATDRDGSMLHICRKYHPEVVVLYLSAEIARYHRRDDRYRAAIRLLAEREHFSPEIRIEERPQLENVQVFDFFLQEYRQILTGLHNEFPDHRILVNISSGTPGMKNAMYLLAAFLPFEILPVQVSTPSRSHNPKGKPDEDYDTALYWELDLDNEDYQDRCREVEYANLNVQLQKENISAHLDSWDYAAALRQAKDIKGMLGQRAYGLLEAARARVELNWRSIPPRVREELGLSSSSGERTDLSEYLLWLQMKQKRGDLADFLRGLTPGLFELLRIASEEKAGISLSVYCDKGRFCRDRMTADETGRELLGMMEWGGKSIDKAFLISGHYATVLNNKCAGADWWQTLSALRDTEERARNLAAHTMTRVDEDWLKEKGLPSSREIMKLLKDAVVKLNNGSRPLATRIAVNWSSYDEMNEKIKDALAES